MPNETTRFHSAVLNSTALHHNYFGDKDFSKRVYEAQIAQASNAVALANTATKKSAQRAHAAHLKALGVL